MNKPESWEPDFDKDFKHRFNFGVVPDDITYGLIKDRIHSLLKQQADKYYYHIENSISTAEAEYIEKMVNQEPTTEKK